MAHLIEVYIDDGRVFSYDVASAEKEIGRAHV
jgi:hypothetical protein